MLRAFSREVGLDPESTVAAYRAQVEIPRETAARIQHPDVQPNRLRTVRGQLASALRKIGRSIDPTWYVAAAGLLAAWMIYVPSETDRARASAASPEPPAAPVSASAEQVDDDRAVGTTGVPPESSAIGLSGESLGVELRAIEQCWVSAVADGHRVVYRLLEPGDRESLSVREELLLRVGNPAGLAFTMNGREGRQLGDGRRPVTVRVTPETYRDLILP